jgi:NRPS condensation-like uncharacterized protein
MSLMLNHQMFKKNDLPLNSLEKFMLAHESDEISYNSQIIVEFEGTLELDKFKLAIEKAINEIPWLRTKVTQGFFQFKRSVVSLADVSLQFNRHLIVKDHILTQDEIDQFCKMKFNIKKAHSFTFLISPLAENKTQLIFNVHHTLCDAAGQFLLLEEIFRLLNSQEVRNEAKEIKTFRYRNLIKHLGKKWVLKQLWANKKALTKQRQYKMAGLIDHPTEAGRTVSSLNFMLSHKQKNFIKELCKFHQVSNTEFLAHCAFQAYDLTLRERGDLTTPIMAYIPKTLRPYLKIRYSFQNILSTVIVVGKREEISGPKFLGKIKHIIQSHKMDQAGKFIFGTLLTCALSPTKKLQQFFKDIDNDPNSITSSMLISAGKVPRSYTFPTAWTNISIWARGTMLKSPGIGVIYTGTNENETITLEFVKELTDLKTIESLKTNLLKILQPDSDIAESETMEPISTLFPKPGDGLFETTTGHRQL